MAVDYYASDTYSITAQNYQAGVRTEDVIKMHAKPYWIRQKINQISILIPYSKRWTLAHKRVVPISFTSQGSSTFYSFGKYVPEGSFFCREYQLELNDSTYKPHKQNETYAVGGAKGYNVAVDFYVGTQSVTLTKLYPIQVPHSFHLTSDIKKIILNSR